MNWELLCESEIKSYCASLKMMFESRVHSIFTEPDILDKILKVINSLNFPLDIQMVIA